MDFGERTELVVVVVGQAGDEQRDEPEPGADESDGSLQGRGHDYRAQHAWCGCCGFSFFLVFGKEVGRSRRWRWCQVTTSPSGGREASSALICRPRAGSPRMLRLDGLTMLCAR